MKEKDRYIVYTEGGIVKKDEGILFLKKNYLNTDNKKEASKHYNYLKKIGLEPYFEEKKVKIYVTKEKKEKWELWLQKKNIK